MLRMRETDDGISKQWNYCHRSINTGRESSQDMYCTVCNTRRTDTQQGQSCLSEAYKLNKISCTCTYTQTPS